MNKKADSKTIVLNAEIMNDVSKANVIFNPTLVYITKGEIEFSMKDQTCTAGQDSLLLISPFDSMRIVSSTDDIEFIKIALNKDRIYDIPSPMLISTLKSRPAGFRNVIDCTNDPLLKVIFDKIVTEYTHDNVLRDTSLDNTIIQLLIELYRVAFVNSPTRHIELITEIQKYIDEEYMKDITIEELGSRFYLDRYYLSHIFREYTGYSLKQYLTLSRLNESRILLSETDLSINEICTTIGFSDINNFIRYFRKEYDTTPLAYRKSIIG